MSWDITFISEEDFIRHIQNTIAQYGAKLLPYDVEKFNSNLIDPIKMVFDKAIYGQTWEELIKSEIFRQRDKSQNNDIGYFHQRMFKYIRGCHVPENGQEGGWDVIVSKPDGYTVDGNTVHHIFVEMKNKHNTMNSSASGKTYIKMQNQLLQNDDCACFLVEAIAKQHQNTVWKTTVDKVKVSHRRIRRVSLDQFYEITTGVPDAFYQICMVLPEYVKMVIENSDIVSMPHDTVIDELRSSTAAADAQDSDTAMLLAMYMLGFSTYTGFERLGGG